jgi:hypothetical protein
MTDSFYYTIQSNASTERFPNNKGDSFKVHQERKQLRGTWAVAVVEAHIPLSFNNVCQKKQNENEEEDPELRKILILEKMINSFEDPLEVVEHNTAGDRSDINKLLNLCSKHLLLKNVLYALRLEFLNTTPQIRDLFYKVSEMLETRDRSRVYDKPNGDTLEKIKPGTEMRLLSGGQETEEDLLLRELIVIGHKKFYKDFPKVLYQMRLELTRRNGHLETTFINICTQIREVRTVYKQTRGPEYLYIYCDIVESELIGDKYGPFLRVVRVPQKTSDVTESKEWAHPHYKNLVKSDFDTIEIDIRDEHGCKVSFEKGTVIVTLHFKKIA